MEPAVMTSWRRELQGQHAAQAHAFLRVCKLWVGKSITRDLCRCCAKLHRWASLAAPFANTL